MAMALFVICRPGSEVGTPLRRSLGCGWKAAPRERGIEYRISEQAKNIYRELVPLLNSDKIELLDHPRLIELLRS